MKAVVILLCLALLAPLAVAQDDHGHEIEPGVTEEILSSGPLYLRGDGSLDVQLGSPSQECLAVDAQSGAQAASYAVLLTNRSHHIESSAVTLSLAFTQGSNPGTGFRIDAELIQGSAAPLAATKTYGQGASLDSPAVLAFETAAVDPSNGTTTLGLTITPLSVGGILPSVLDVGIQCQNSDSRFYSFEFATFTATQGVAPVDEHNEGGIRTLYVVLISIGAAIVTLVAGILPLIGRALAPRRLHLFLGITAGLLLSIALVDLIPEAIEGGGPDVAWTIALGVLVLYAVKHIAGETHSHGGQEEHDHPDHHAPDADDEHTDPHAGRFALVAFGALMFHRLVDGVALPGAFAAGGDVGFAASAAILLHQFPDGLAAASVFLAAGWQKSKVFWRVVMLAFATPLGSIIGLSIAGFEGTLPHLLALAAATFIFIALAELLPELRAKKYRYVVIVGFLLGYVLTFGIELFAAAVGGGHGH